MFKLGDVREGQVELRGRGWRSEKGWGRSNGETVVRQTNEENELETSHGLEVISGKSVVSGDGEGASGPL